MKSIKLLLTTILLHSALLAVAQITPTAPATPLRGTTTSGPYKVGDYYNEQGLEGVVFEVSEDGMSGKIVGLTQSRGVRRWSISHEGRTRLLGATDLNDGAANCRLIMQFDGWQEKFPAIAWCVARGEGWYLPAIHELKEFTKNPITYQLVNNCLTAIGATPLPKQGEWIDFWSSTERDYRYDSGDYCAWSVNMKNGVTRDSGKYLNAYLRPVAAFPLELAKESLSMTSSQTSAPYAVGDLYDDGTRRGVVFEVDAEGAHGKIVSISQVELAWAMGEQCKVIIGAKSESDGRENMAVIMLTEGWQQLFPAAAWCAALGEGWYLPAIEEVRSLLRAESNDAINATLDTLLATPLHKPGTWKDYWSSTEVQTIYTPDEEYEGDVNACAVGFYLYDNAAHETTKASDLSVRAIAEF